VPLAVAVPVAAAVALVDVAGVVEVVAVVELAGFVELVEVADVGAAAGPDAEAAATVVEVVEVVAVDVALAAVAPETDVGDAAVGAAAAYEVAAGSATGPVNSGGAFCRPTTPWVSSAATSTGTSPIAGTSHHQRQAGAATPRLDRTA
jgi:hypothetical protein